MKTIQTILVLIVVLEHLYFLVLEMFLWTTPKAIKAFGLQSKEFAEDTKVMAANQGLYNGFLALGLLYALVLQDTNFMLFFLGCITFAGIYGAYSTKIIKLFYIQSIPAIAGFIFIMLNNV